MDPNVILQQDPFSGFYPGTLTAAATLVPKTATSFVTGSTQVTTITPPVPGPHLLTLIFTDAAPSAFATSGNLAKGVTPAQNTALVLAYEPRTAKYYPAAVSGIIPVAGATAGPFTTITSITVVNGLVTALTGSA